MKTLILLTLLPIVSWIDIKTKVIHDGLTLIGVIVALNLQLFYGDIHEAVVGMTAGIAIMWILNLIKAQNVGGGDAKLMALIGACLGWFPCVTIAILALVFCNIYRMLANHQRTLAYAPFITAGFLLERACHVAI